MTIVSEHFISAELADWQTPVKDKDLTTSPGAPANGDRYVIAGTGGDWSAGTINDIVWYINSSWYFITPTEGMQVYVEDENLYYFYNGSAWGTVSGGSGDMLKSTYDTNDNGIVDKSTTIDDGAGNSASASDVKDAVTKKHTEGSDTTLGAQTENLDMNTHKITGVVNPTSAQDGATKNYVDARTDIVTVNTDNIILNAFRIAINGSLTQFNMEDGIVDEYEDESGIDTSASTGEDYNSVDDYYSPSGSGGIDSDTKLMLHCDGSDTSTTFTDSKPTNPHTVTANGDAQLDTASKKWGTASGLFDGTGDYLSIPDSDDWDIIASNSDDWTIDLQVKHTDHAGYEMYVGQYEANGEQWMLKHIDGTGLQFLVYSAGQSIISLSGGEITDTDWHHIALCKVADKYGLYKDGTQVAYVQDSSTDTFSGTLKIGSRGDSGGEQWFDGHMDEVRIQHSNVFSALPNSGKTDTITVPTQAYTSSQADDMVLISDTFVAESAPDDGRIVILEEDIDSITLNTDLKVWMTIDSGSNWHQGTLSDTGDFDTNKRILVADFDVSAQTNTNVEYKITTHNEKKAKIHATGLSWK